MVKTRSHLIAKEFTVIEIGSIERHPADDEHALLKIQQMLLILMYIL